MKYIIENVTDEEIEILDREGIFWYPESLYTNDIVIEGSENYYKMVLNAIRR